MATFGVPKTAEYCLQSVSSTSENYNYRVTNKYQCLSETFRIAVEPAVYDCQNKHNDYEVEDCLRKYEGKEMVLNSTNYYPKPKIDEFINIKDSEIEAALCQQLSMTLEENQFECSVLKEADTFIAQFTLNQGNLNVYKGSMPSVTLRFGKDFEYANVKMTTIALNDITVFQSD